MHEIITCKNQLKSRKLILVLSRNLDIEIINNKMGVKTDMQEVKQMRNICFNKLKTQKKSMQNS